MRFAVNKTIPMNLCPRDRQILATNEVGGYRYYSCEHCKGFWIPGTSLHRALSTKGVTELGSVPSCGKGEIRCPNCLTDCDSILIEVCRLDLCPNCRGVWLDSGEVRQLRRLFSEGSPVVIADEGGGSKEIRPVGALWDLAEGVEILVELFSL